MLESQKPFILMKLGKIDRGKIKIRAADAKEVGVGNPAEETCCYPNKVMLHFSDALSTFFLKAEQL